MRYEPIDSSLFERNRKRFTQMLPAGSVAIFNANDPMPTNADMTLPFRQNNDLFHLSGIDQEETILVLFPDAFYEKYREILFLKETSEEIAIWEGQKLSREEARKVSGVDNVQWLSRFEGILREIMDEAEHVFLDTNEHLRADDVVETRDDRFRKWIQYRYPLHDYRRSAPLMRDIRVVKDDLEVDLLSKACKITEKGFRRILPLFKPGIKEFEIEAELLHEFMREQSRGFPYEPIVASGSNACILHYTDNNDECREGELVLMDFGAEYANYASDMTRCVPVNGRFSERQKAVYQAVRRVQKEALDMLRPGTYLDEYQKEVGKLVETELIALGLLDKKDVEKQDDEAPLYKKFFMHGTSHHIGLDVHDVGAKRQPLKEGMVLTCEPGIYIREEGIGVRLENDVVVTDGAPKDLMGDIPIEVEEIEDLMNQ